VTGLGKQHFPTHRVQRRKRKSQLELWLPAVEHLQQAQPAKPLPRPLAESCVAGEGLTHFS